MQFRICLLMNKKEISLINFENVCEFIKYFNENITAAYKDLEELSCKKLIDKLPKELQEEYTKAKIKGRISPPSIWSIHYT